MTAGAAIMKFPQPVELAGDELERRNLAQRIGRAVSDQHPGVQIAEAVTDDGFALELSHPAHNWSMRVARGPEDTATTLEAKAKRRAMAHYLDQWQRRLLHVMHATEITNAGGEEMPTANGLMATVDLWRQAKRGGRKVIFIGNGGSSAIAGHMAEDLTKNGGIRAITFNDPALLTCYGNDYGWARAYAEMIAHYADPGDVLVAISSSGMSESILAAVSVAQGKAVPCVTFSGFTPENKLRTKGMVNFWTPSMQYGFVETAHAAFLHAVLDMHMGWVGQQ